MFMTKNKYLNIRNTIIVSFFLLHSLILLPYNVAAEDSDDAEIIEHSINESIPKDNINDEEFKEGTNFEQSEQEFIENPAKGNSNLDELIENVEFDLNTNGVESFESTKEDIENIDENEQSEEVEGYEEKDQATSQIMDENNSLFSEGNKDPLIKKFKEDLTRVGFTPWTKPNEIYGPETVTYVKNFQSYYGLTVTGNGDKATQNKLAEILNSSYQSGKSSTQIKEVKIKLKTLGFAPHWNAPNNNYGPETVEVVKNFQIYNGLVVNGIIDSVTMNKIEEQLNTPFTLGMNRPDVKLFKEDLTAVGFTPWTNPNENYGPETVVYVKKFQSYYGLSVTGNGDNATKSKLKEVINSQYQLGKSSLKIKEVKTKLKRLGFAPHWNIPNNNYGLETVDVVRNFQKYYGLVVNGIADSVTLNNIDKVLSSPYQSGRNSKAIAEYKNKLKKLGFAPHWNVPNNNYGPETVTVVNNFQKHFDLKVNGIIDKVTAAKIEHVLSSPYQSGKSSSEIRQIKTNLMVLGFAPQWTKPNNNYGPETVSVVKNFQRHNNLPVSGIVDEITFSKIKNAFEDYNNRKIRIYLDVGHGGNDTGAYYGGIAEREINLEVSKKIVNRLESYGHEVIMSRTDRSNSHYYDSKKELFARPKKANELGVDLYLSVHHNAMPFNSSVTGIETYFYGPDLNYPPLEENRTSHDDPDRLKESKKVANAIHSELIKATGATDRGVRDNAFVVVREAKMPAVLLELGYMSNSRELKLVTSNWYQEILADAVVRGVNRYYGK